jgi:hypothetical protein
VAHLNDLHIATAKCFSHSIGMCCRSRSVGEVGRVRIRDPFTGVAAPATVASRVVVGDASSAALTRNSSARLASDASRLTGRVLRAGAARREIRPEITLRDLLDRFSYDCLWRAEARSQRGQSACGVYLPDLEQKRPPDKPPGMVKLRLVKR